MKVKNCTLLAASLTANYRSTKRFDHKESITQYLQSNGILLSMCPETPWSSCGLRSNHISASWIQRNTTGTQLFPSGSVGVILDPAVVEMDCIYPTDADTDRRTHRGCGPVTVQQGYHYQIPSNPISRYFEKQRWIDYKNFNFGMDTQWTDIPCDLLLRTRTSYSNTWIRGESDDNAVVNFIDVSRYFMWKGLKELLGFPPCSTVDDPMVTPMNGSIVVYVGDTAWEPTADWNEMVDILHSLTQSGLYVFNEIVVKKPSELRDLVQAVFYRPVNDYNDGNEASKQNALRHAKIWGNDIPVLKIDFPTVVGQDIAMTCVSPSNEDPIAEQGPMQQVLTDETATT